MSYIDSDWQNEWQPKARRTYDQFDAFENEVAVARRHIKDYEADVRYKQDPKLTDRLRRNVEAE